MNLTTVNFHGADLIAVRGDTPETTMVAMRPVVEGMGLDWSAQRKKIMRHPVLSKGVVVMASPSAGGAQDMTALPLSKLNFWLATVQPDRIPDETTRARVIAYQIECADVLFEHFFGKALAARDLTPEIAGGVFKGVLTKHDRTVLVPLLRAEMVEIVREMVPAMVASAITADPRHAAVTDVSQRQLIERANVPSKGRNRLNRKFSYWLPRYAIASGVLPKVCPHSSVLLYPVDMAESFMRERGNGWIADHKARVMGQTILPFVKGPRQ